jgi:2-polyprenyl-3-methyl-5-hydroxy-6-metoxy-1,4-benzoquinol methylase
MRKCVECGLLFNSPRLPDDQFPALYDRDYYFFSRGAKQEFFRILEMYQRTVACLKEEIRPRNVLEIGSAKGYLLALLKAFGWQVQGVEISAYAAQYAEKHFGVPTFHGTLDTYLETAHNIRFSLVLVIDVFEHILSPPAFLRAIARVIWENGILILDTPNGNALNIFNEGPSWKGFNPFHIFVFSPMNIIRLLQMNGYRVERLFSYRNVQHAVQFNFVQYILSFLLKLGVRGLASIQLANQFRILYQKARQIFRIMEDTQKDLAGAVDTLPQGLPYHDTEDSKGELAARCQGDNMVIMARKIRE